MLNDNSTPDSNCSQYEQIGRIDVTMAIVISLQLLYIADSVIAEESILTTMDITTVRLLYDYVYDADPIPCCQACT